MSDKIFEIFTGDEPLIITAIHDGHEVREELSGLFAISEPDRLREEDPFTGLWTAICGNRIIVKRSRFEIDLNRPREEAVYIKPEDAWGLKVWKSKPSDEIISRSMAEYDLFYSEAHKFFSNIEKKYQRFVVFDLHSYNHRRAGPDGPIADQATNPEVNIGTGTLNRECWGNLVDRFMTDLHQFNFLGRHLDVRENIKFRGGNFSRWIHQTFPNSACTLAIEFKKFFMDEWTGKPDESQIQTITDALKSTIPGVMQELNKLCLKK